MVPGKLTMWKHSQEKWLGLFKAKLTKKVGMGGIIVSYSR